MTDAGRPPRARRSFIFTPGYFMDGSGKTFTPREAVTKIAEVSPVPVYGRYNTFIGTGVVGGRVPIFEAMGAMAGPVAADAYPSWEPPRTER